MEAQQDLALVPQKIQAATRRTETCWAVLEPAVRPDQMAQATLPAAVNPPTAVLVARPIMAAGEQVVLEAPVPEQRAVPDQQALSTIRLQLSDRAAAVVAGLAQCHPRLATEALAAGLEPAAVAEGLAIHAERTAPGLVARKVSSSSGGRRQFNRRSTPLRVVAPSGRISTRSRTSTIWL
jgi:hypothetical protein